MSDCRLTFIECVGGRKALYRCGCGVEKVLDKYNVHPYGNTKSCGCLNKEAVRERRTTHSAQLNGKKPSKTYQCWKHMRRRCLNKGGPRYADYGGRGIGICERWNDFALFLVDMGECPEDCSLDRIDNNKGYSPENCRWATDSQQANNKRNNVPVAAFGRTETVTWWAEQLGVKRQTLYVRLWRGKRTVEENLLYGLDVLEQSTLIQRVQVVTADTFCPCI